MGWPENPYDRMPRDDRDKHKNPRNRMERGRKGLGYGGTGGQKSGCSMWTFGPIALIVIAVCLWVFW